MLCTPQLWSNFGRIIMIIATSGQFLTIGRIAVSSPLAVANGFVRPWLHLTNAFLGPRESAFKRHLDRFSRLCVHRSKDSVFFNGANNPQKLPLPLGRSGHHLIRVRRSAAEASILHGSVVWSDGGIQTPKIIGNVMPTTSFGCRFFVWPKWQEVMARPRSNCARSEDWQNVYEHTQTV